VCVVEDAFDFMCVVTGCVCAFLVVGFLPTYSTSPDALISVNFSCAELSGGRTSRGGRPEEVVHCNEEVVHMLFFVLHHFVFVFQ
jgi:hypothetical protein